LSAEQQPDQPQWWAAISQHIKQPPAPNDFTRKMLADKMGIDMDAAKVEIARLIKLGVIEPTQIYARQMWYRAICK